MANADYKQRDKRLCLKFIKIYKLLAIFLTLFNFVISKAVPLVSQLQSLQQIAEERKVCLGVAGRTPTV